MKRAIAGLLIFAAGCSSEGTNKAERQAQRELSERVRDAMCTPWGVKREGALADLVEAAQNANLEEPPTNEYIRDIAGDVDEENCQKAGFKVSGSAIIDVERLRRRCRWIHVPLPPATNPVDQERIESSREKLREKCATLPVTGAEKS